MNQGKKEAFKILLIDEYKNEIVADTDTASLSSMLVWKQEYKRQKQLKSTNKALTDYYGEKLMVFQDILKRASKELSSEELRVFNFMLAVCDFENWINLSQAEIGKEMEILPQNIYRAIKGLANKNYVEVIKKGRNNFYRINPEMAWKGSLDTWKKVVEIRRIDPKKS